MVGKGREFGVIGHSLGSLGWDGAWDAPSVLPDGVTGAGGDLLSMGIDMTCDVRENLGSDVMAMYEWLVMAGGTRGRAALHISREFRFHHEVGVR